MKNKIDVNVIHIPDSKNLFVVIDEKFKLICSVSKEPFYGTINIIYNIGNNENQIELVSFRKWIKSLGEQTVESLTINVFNKISDKLDFGSFSTLRVEVIAKSKIHPEITVVKGQ